MLTGHDTDSDTILGLESGANDYITKPFRFAVLLARIRAQLRQHEASEDAVFTIGPYTFRPSSKLLLNPKGSKVRLTEKETAILRYLYRAGQKPVSRETLLQEVWGYNSGVTTHTLETHASEVANCESSGSSVQPPLPPAPPRTDGGNRPRQVEKPCIPLTAPACSRRLPSPGSAAQPHPFRFSGAADRCAFPACGW